MGQTSKLELNISITDDVISFVEKEPGIKEVESYGEIKLPRNVIKNGYIKDPEVVLEKIKTIMKSFKIKAKQIRWIINPQNVILREIDIEKVELETKSVEEYVKDQIGKTIHFPFKDPVFTYEIKDATDDTIIVTLYVFDENLIQDYLDVFERVGIKKVTYDVAELSLYKLFYEKDEGRSADDDELITMDAPFMEDEDEDQLLTGLMFVMVHENNVSISIFDREYPVMSIIEDVENPEEIFDTVEQYIARISNYYRYNRNQGRQTINHVVIFNLTSEISEERMAEEMQTRLQGSQYEIFDLGNKSQYYKRLLPGGCYTALASSLYK